MIAVDIFDQVDTIRFDKLNKLPLHLWASLGELNGLLHNSAAVAVLRKLENMIFYDFE
jgi:hypothetical protein